MSPLPPLADIRAAHAPAVVILGNDAQLAAQPATPVQLAHACLAAGFRAVVPVSWGDELVAGATLTALAGRATRPAIHCACPHVARRVLAVGSELAPHLISLVAPPVAAARYLRLHSAGELRITYAGRCPAAADDSIDARVTPEELLAQLADRGIDPAAQPEVFESVIPPDRRRHLSLPGGLPSPEMLWTRDRFVVETMKAPDFAAELADLVLARRDALIDAAPTVGCVCSGAVRGAEPAHARASVVALEPPRSAHPVVEESVALSLELPLPSFARAAVDVIADRASTAPRDEQHTITAPPDALGDAPPSPPVVPNRRPRLTPPGVAVVGSAPPAGASPAAPPPRRRSPAGTPRVVPGAVPVSSDSEGRLLPRAYVARRRSPRSGIPVVTDVRPAGDAAAGALAAPAAHGTAPRHTVPTERGAETTPASADNERPVARSVEPPAASPMAPTPPARAPQPPSAAIADTAALVGARFAAGMELLRRRSWLVAASLLAGTGLLLGVAIGYSVAHRRAIATSGSELPDRGDTISANPAPRSAGVRESVSAGGIAPVPGTSRRGPLRSATRQPTTGQRPASRAAPPPQTPERSVGQARPVSPSAPAVTVAPSSAPLGATLRDSTALRARRDSIARAESLAAERESIRREIELRRARLDSIERARIHLDSLQRAEQTGGRPPDR